ncbi:hypothetical protein AaE_009185, partial [Aphanomyces astaci]
ATSKVDMPMDTAKRAGGPIQRSPVTEKPTQAKGKAVAVSNQSTPVLHFTNDTDLHKYLAAKLPEKWDMQLTPKGKPYFRNFTTRSTQWNHPVADVDAVYRDYLLHKKGGSAK